MNEKQQIKLIHQQLIKKVNLDECLKITVHRSNIFEDSYSFFKKKQSSEFLKKISIIFIGEENNCDESNTKEWFNLLVNEILNPESKLFVPSPNENCVQPNTLSNVKEHHLEYFRFAGQIISLAIINNVPVNAHFTPFFLKHILHRPVTFKDLEDADENLYTSLHQMLQNDITSPSHTFSIAVKNIGLNMTIELKPAGTKIDVTNDNKKEYVNLVADYYMIKSIKDQIESFCEGFNSLINFDELKKVTPKDLDLLICGINEIDLDDFRKNIVFVEPYTNESIVIKFLFDAIAKWDNEDLVKLIMFITGTSKVPDGGFQMYRKIGRPISIRNGGFEDSLPVAHTRFNMLDLPDYQSEEQLNEKLRCAIQENQYNVL